MQKSPFSPPLTTPLPPWPHSRPPRPFRHTTGERPAHPLHPTSSERLARTSPPYLRRAAGAHPSSLPCSVPCVDPALPRRSLPSAGPARGHTTPDLCGWRENMAGVAAGVLTCSRGGRHEQPTRERRPGEHGSGGLCAGEPPPLPLAPLRRRPRHMRAGVPPPLPLAPLRRRPRLRVGGAGGREWAEQAAALAGRRAECGPRGSTEEQGCARRRAACGIRRDGMAGGRRYRR
jgi:hypothetical protein